MTIFKNNTVNEGVQAAPSVIYTILYTLFNLDLNQWLALASIGFILLQSSFLVWKWLREAKKK